MSRRAELGRWVETTSVKGVGRAYKSPITILRVIWTISVLLFLGLAVYQTYDLINGYYLNPTVTYIEQVFIDTFFNADSLYEAPDLTICNLNPYASNISLGNIPRIPAYSHLVQNAATDCTEGCLYSSRGDSMLDLLLTTSGYYQYIGHDSAQNRSHTYSNFVASCSVEIFDGFASIYRPCETVATIKIVTYPQLFNCFTLKVPVNNVFFISGYSMVFHLDNYEREQHAYFISEYEYSQSLGAVVIPHMTGTRAWIGRDAIHIPPAAHTDVKLRLQQSSRMEPRYGTCAEIENIPRNENWSYSVKGCISSCLEYRIAKDCGCQDASLMGILESANRDKPYCLQLYPDLNITKSFYDCAAELRLEAYPECAATCPAMCQQITYNADTSQSYWPPSRTSQVFYDSYIANKSYEHRYSALYEADIRAYEDLVKKNFLSMEIYISDFNVIHYKDVVKTTFFGLLSQLGAALNLWAGITVVLVVEILEVIIRILLYPKPEPDNQMSLSQQPSNGRQASQTKL